MGILSEAEDTRFHQYLPQFLANPIDAHKFPRESVEPRVAKTQVQVGAGKLYV